MKKLKHFIIKHCPKLLIWKGWLIAWKDRVLPVKRSYSQAGEDVIVERLLEREFSRSLIYIDVGANHPTRLSNTYRFYRNGWRGFVVEPNQSMLKMHRVIRPEDQHLAIGCGDKPALLGFHHASSHVLSGFSKEKMKSKSIRKTELIPVLPLDLILSHHEDMEVGLLSVDVEGLDLEVVRGAVELLKRTHFVIIEGDENNKEILDLFQANGFFLVDCTDHNLIFENRNI